MKRKFDTKQENRCKCMCEIMFYFSLCKICNYFIINVLNVMGYFIKNEYKDIIVI